jgi:hypothetical protein
MGKYKISIEYYDGEHLQSFDLIVSHDSSGHWEKPIVSFERLED